MQSVRRQSLRRSKAFTLNSVYYKYNATQKTSEALLLQRLLFVLRVLFSVELISAVNTEALVGINRFTAHIAEPCRSIL